MAGRDSAVPVDEIDVSVYRIPTDGPESDGTFAWDATTMVLVEARAGGCSGVGYTYADEGTGQLVRDTLMAVVRGRDAMDVPACWAAMVHEIRNLGRPGVSSMAIAAVAGALGE